jgi:hypothetical protein
MGHYFCGKERDGLHGLVVGKITPLEGADKVAPFWSD